MGTDQHICQAVKDHSKYSHEADPCHRFCFALPCCHRIEAQYGSGYSSYYPYYGGGQRRSRGIGGGLLALLGLLFLIPFLFTNSSTQDRIILVNSTLNG